jgi:hypothetical protein
MRVMILRFLESQMRFEELSNWQRRDTEMIHQYLADVKGNFSGVVEFLSSSPRGVSLSIFVFT